jgi:hypothetical protein
MVGVEHLELSNSSLGRLNDVGLTEKTIEFVTEDTPAAPNGRLGVESKKWLPPYQGDVTEVGCCIGDTLSFLLELSRLVVEDHDAARDERSEKAWLLAGEFVGFRSIGITVGDSLRVGELILEIGIPRESGLRPRSPTRRWYRRARRSGGSGWSGRPNRRCSGECEGWRRRRPAMRDRNLRNRVWWVWWTREWRLNASDRWCRPLGNCISGANTRGYVLDRVQRDIASDVRVIVRGTRERRVWIPWVLSEGRGSGVPLPTSRVLERKASRGVSPR